MKSIIGNIIENMEKYPGKAVLFDDIHPKGITFSELNELSGKIYHWLKDRGVGKEDFVLINLPRGIMPIIAMVGIWRAGAAFALVEDSYAPERINYIREDSGCKAELNEETWNEATMLSSLEGFEEADEHDAAYAIYTSGTTGKPKGVLHEYGNLMEAYESVGGDSCMFLKPGDRISIMCPLNFVAAVILAIVTLCYGDVKTYIVSYATLKNPLKLMRFLLEKRINGTFLTPSYARKFSGKTGPFLKKIIVASEPANDIYMENVELYNAYAMSESGCVLTIFKIDKAYDTCPIGKPFFDKNIVILDEEGNEVSDGEMGELCYENKYVRGYMNLPEETADSFKPDFYHSGDLAIKNPNGDFVLLGRSNDMIKINGNRIEPAEVEAAVKSVLGIDWAAARGFEEQGQSFLCAYYTADVKVDKEEMREELLKRLPYYMIPAYYIRIDEIPMKANGKMDRSALPKPDTKDFANDYVPPETNIQKALCEAFQKVLKLERVGIRDDFYEMGGDSLSAIELISVSELPGLSASVIFRGRTIEKIAELYEKNHAEDDGMSPDEKNDISMKQPHLLTTEQLYMVDYQLKTPMSTMYNLFTLLKFDKDDYDMNRMAEALETAIKNHPVLLTTYSFNDDGEIVQTYTPEVLSPILVEKKTDWEFKYTVKDYLVQPFKICDQKVPHKLHRCRVFETEKAGYVFFDVHHSIFDGTSFKIFMGNIMQAYMGLELNKDYYYLMLQKREDSIGTEFYEESKKYFEEKYEGVEWELLPKPDKGRKNSNELGEIVSEMGVSSAEISQIEKLYKISRNEFFITVAGLTMAIYNKKKNIMLNWIYNGREDMEMISTVGLLFRELPVAVCFDDHAFLRDIYMEVHDQVQKGIEHSCYPYVDLKTHGTDIEAAYLLYQQDLRDVDDEMDLETVDIRQNQAATQTMMDMEVLDGSDGLRLLLDYASDVYSDESMNEYNQLFMKVTKVLVSHDSQENVTIGQLRKEIKEHKMLGKVKAILRRRKKF